MTEIEVVWLQRQVLDALHDRLLAEHGGASGVRDEDLLQSALARLQNAAAYGETDLCALAALHAHGIVRNHPFVDGNKRTGFMAAFVFLARNGRRLTASEDDATQTMLALAADDIDERTFADWLRANTEPAA